MYNKTKNILAWALATAIYLAAWISYAAPGEIASNGSTKFSMTEVKVIDTTTLKISFNKDLFEDASLFELSLSPKKDDKKDIALTWITLSASSELTVKTVEELITWEDYNLVAVFVSDKENNVIENGVDGIIDFKANIIASDSESTENVWIPPEVTDVATETATTAVSEEPQDLNAAWTATEEPSLTATEAAADPKALPVGWPKETLIVILALMLGLWFFLVRRKA